MKLSWNQTWSYGELANEKLETTFTREYRTGARVGGAIMKHKRPQEIVLDRKDLLAIMALPEERLKSILFNWALALTEAPVYPSRYTLER